MRETYYSTGRNRHVNGLHLCTSADLGR